jgi:hypothetical protein
MCELKQGGTDMTGKRLVQLVAAVAFAVSLGGLAAPLVRAETFTLRIASGHPPAVVYAGQMKDYFQPELKKRVEERTKHKINWVEGYGGSIVKVYETLGGRSRQHRQHWRVLLLLRAGKPAAPRLPGHAAVRSGGSNR